MGLLMVNKFPRSFGTPNTSLSIEGFGPNHRELLPKIKSSAGFMH